MAPENTNLWEKDIVDFMCFLFLMHISLRDIFVDVISQFGK